MGDTTIYLRKNEWWEGFTEYYTCFEDEESISLLRGAVGACLSQSNPPPIEVEDYIEIIKVLNKIMIDDVAYYPIYIEGRLRIQSYIETPEDGFNRSNDVYVTDDDNGDVTYLVKLKNGIIVKAKVNHEKTFVSGSIPWITDEELEDRDGDDVEQMEINNEDVVGWKRYIE